MDKSKWAAKFGETFEEQLQRECCEDSERELSDADFGKESGCDISQDYLDEDTARAIMRARTGRTERYDLKWGSGNRFASLVEDDDGEVDSSFGAGASSTAVGSRSRGRPGRRVRGNRSRQPLQLQRKAPVPAAADVEVVDVVENLSSKLKLARPWSSRSCRPRLSAYCTILSCLRSPVSFEGARCIRTDWCC